MTQCLCAFPTITPFVICDALTLSIRTWTEVRHYQNYPSQGTPNLQVIHGPSRKPSHVSRLWESYRQLLSDKRTPICISLCEQQPMESKGTFEDVRRNTLVVDKSLVWRFASSPKTNTQKIPLSVQFLSRRFYFTCFGCHKNGMCVRSGMVLVAFPLEDHFQKPDTTKDGHLTTQLSSAQKNNNMRFSVEFLCTGEIHKVDYDLTSD